MAKDTTFDPMALLSKPVDEIKALPPMPLGSYLAVATNYEFDKIKSKKDDSESTLVRVNVRLTEAFPDVDQEQLAEALNGKQLSDIDMRTIDFFLTEAAGWRLKEFLEHAGCGGAEGFATLAEGLEAVKGGDHPFGVEITSSPNAKNPERPFHNISRTFKPE